MKLNKEFKIAETKSSDGSISATYSMIYKTAVDENRQSAIILHTHFPNAVKGCEDRYQVFVEV